MTIRIIPRLDIKGPNLVKGIHLEGLRVLGRPEEFAHHYYENGADELLYMDIVASLYQRNNLEDIVSRTARDIFIPMTVGGGLRSLQDINSVLRSGADKVCLNTAAIHRPQLIEEAANTFGSSTIVISIEAIKHADGTYEAYTDNGREATGIEALEWAKQAANLGCGEILITSIDKEGTGTGYDIDLVKQVSESVSIPVIACGGAGKVIDVIDVLKHGRADAVCLGSLLHYNYLQCYETQKNIPLEGNTEYLKNNQVSTRIQHASLPEINKSLSDNGYPRRSITMTNELN